MTINIGINGFGRIGRLVLRAAFDTEAFNIYKINDPFGDSETMAHLLEFDSVHGQWPHQIEADEQTIDIDGHSIEYTQVRDISDNDWSECDIVIDASGKFKARPLLEGYLHQGVKHVVVTAPIKSEGIANIVMGINEDQFDPNQYDIVTAASCTTNCLAPIVSVIHEHFGIRHGSMTTIHALTNTQTILDAPRKDLRRSRASGLNLIPTTTGSAMAIGEIFPDLKGKLNGHAVRVPLTNASITDCVFELQRATIIDEVNDALQHASETYLQGILGFEQRPLVSIDYRTDPRSSIIDAPSTLVIGGTQVKIYAWYDSEWGYSNRVVDLMHWLAESY